MTDEWIQNSYKIDFNYRSRDYEGKEDCYRARERG